MANTEEKKAKLSPAQTYDAELPDGVDALLEDLPEEQRAQVKKLVVEQSFAMMGIGRSSQENQIAKKLNEGHITDYLAGAREQMQNSFKERRENKIFTGILVFFALVFFIIVIVLLKDTPDVLEKIIYSVVGLIAGAFGGYGYGRHKSNDD